MCSPLHKQLITLQPNDIDLITWSQNELGLKPGINILGTETLKPYKLFVKDIL